MSSAVVAFMVVGLGVAVGWTPSIVATSPMRDVTRHLSVTPDILALDAPPGVAAGTASPEGPATGLPPVETRTPNTLGDDPNLDDLWVRCEEGSGYACDRLFAESPAGSVYERFGVSCGERPAVLDCQADLDGQADGPLVDGWPVPFAPLDS